MVGLHAVGQCARSPGGTIPLAAVGFLWLLSCAAPTVDPDAASDLVPSPPTVADLLEQWSELEASDPAAFVTRMQAEIAAGEHFAPAALFLADHLAQHERLGDALDAIELARVRAPDRLDLAFARVQLLLDLGMIDGADEELLALYGRIEHPRILWEAARVALAAQRPDDARGHLARLRQQYRDHVWVQENADAIAQLEERASHPRAHLRPREILALQRTSTDPVLRLRALKTLAAIEAPELAVALRLGMEDSEPLVRVAALQLGAPVVQDLLDWIDWGLRDEAPQVRGAAASEATALPSRQGVALLMSFLDTEQSGYVVRRMNQALNELAGDSHVVPAGLGDTEDGREEIRAYWRQHWGQ